MESDTCYFLNMSGVRLVLPIDIPMYQTSMQEAMLMAKMIYFPILYRFLRDTMTSLLSLMRLI